MAREDGTHRMESILLHSASGDGYNDLTPLSAILRGLAAMTGENSAEARLREKLRKIEALFAGAGTAGEKAAAGAAADRIRALLGNAAGSEAPQEIRFSVPDIWSRKLFIALCRRYGIRPFRYHRTGDTCRGD